MSKAATARLKARPDTNRVFFNSRLDSLLGFEGLSS